MAYYQVPVRVVISGTAQVVLPDGRSQEEAEEVVRQLDLSNITLLSSPGRTTHVKVSDVEVEVV